MKAKSFGKLCLILLITAIFLALSIFSFGGKNKFAASNIKQGLDLKGGVSILYEAKDYSPTPAELGAAQLSIQKRLDEKGYTEAEVAPSGTKRLMVDIPGIGDAQKAADTIGQTAQLTFTDAAGNVLLDGTGVKSASTRLQNDPVKGQKYVVELEFNSAGQAAFSKATGDNVGKIININIDGVPISSPTVDEKINSSTAQITGNFTQESADNLSSNIRSGSLPFSLTNIYTNQVGAKLGEEALATSLKAGFIGICLVLIFMLVAYRTFGVVADLALLLYVGLEIFLLNLFGVTLTLPGIAGIILSVGMAVDANIIIFERVKEEMYAGKTLRSAAKAGFSRAFPAILDGNITTLIAAVILFWLGTGTIKGFAQTLAIGIILSMFTALVVTKGILNCFIGMGVTDKKYYGVKVKEEDENTHKVLMKIIENRFKIFTISAIVVACGLAVMLINNSKGNGLFNYDVEFAGGTSYTFDIGKDFNNTDIEKIIKDTTGQSSAQVQKITGTNDVQIKMKSIDTAKEAAFKKALYDKYGLDEKSLTSSSNVSATISNEMQKNAVVAVLIACIAMLIYVSLRFKDWKMGSSAIVALLHDAIIVILTYAVVRIPLNYSFIAVVLTILGYSINSTIVIFDRVRENKHINPRLDNTEYVNKSVTQTIRRSIYTSLTTLLPVVCLYFMGVPSIQQFTLPIIIGVAVGTYSSVFLSGSVWFTLSKKRDVK